MSSTATRITGVGAARGIARGRWADLARPSLPEARPVAASEVPAEVLRLRAAAQAAGRELMALSESVRAAGHEAEAAIFKAHALMARDPELIGAAAREIESRLVDASTAIASAGRESAARLAALDDERLRARATDVLEVAERMARSLAGLSGGPVLDGPAIVVADDLGPAATATLPRELVLGLVLERSSSTSHAAILARAYGIPAVVGASGALAAVRAAGVEAEVLIDGSSGEVVVAPSPADLARFGGLAADVARAQAVDLAEATVPATTVDGLEISLLANLGRPDEAVKAVALGATGVGLFRTEFLFLERASPPSEDEQTAAYRTLVEAFPGRPVTIRLLDVGGDKPIPYLPLPKEDNPFLGVRSLRLAVDRPEVFITQIRACHRAAVAGPVRIMAPMIADAVDTAAFVELVERARAELQRDGVPFGPVEVGVMLEIPSAVLTAASYFDGITFASLGTNDLLQYTLAVDRGNAALERYRDPLHPALLRLIRLSVEAAEKRDVSLSVCGEMAADPVAALALVGLGIRALSMVPSSLPGVRRAIRHADAGQLRAEAEAACFDRSAAAARARIARLLRR